MHRLHRVGLARYAALLYATALWVSTEDTAAVVGGAPGSAGSAGTSDTGLTDFNHALAVQATPDQASRFLSLAKRHGGREEAGAGSAPVGREGR